MLRALHDAARMLGETAPFFRLLFPLLALGGSALFFWYGWQGIVKRRTRLLGRTQAGVLNRGWVTGGAAVFVGLCQVLVGVFVLALLAPMAAAMWGLW
jgi:hypothetical protein